METKMDFITKKGVIRRLLTMALGLIMAVIACVTVLPGTEMTVKAAGTGKNLQIVTGGSAPNIEGAQVNSVYFGVYNQSGTGVDPIKWRVLQNSGSQLFLLADDNLDCKEYNESDSLVTWESCTLRTWLNDNFINSAFSGAEMSSIADTSVINSDNPDYGTSGGNNTTDKLLLLSIDEVRNTTYGFTDDNSRLAEDTAYTSNYAILEYGPCGPWWQRSPGIHDDFSAAYVHADGEVSTSGLSVDISEVAIRPALNLNLSAIIFTSAAVDGKLSGTVGADLTLVNVSNLNTKWKLTVADSARSSFTASRTDLDTLTPGGTAEISYSGAQIGTNEYVSAIITDSSDTVLYYGNIASCTSATGIASINIPSAAPAGCKLYVFQEQCNGNYMTDYSSGIINLTALGSSGVGTVAATPTQDSEEAPQEPEDIPEFNYLDPLEDLLDYAISLGGERTVYWRGGTALPSNIMKTLEENPQLTLVFSYTYEYKDYEVTIPGKKVKTDPKIPWYGPLYLYGHYGK